MQQILTVCVGNICRSPVAAAILQKALPAHSVTSAGIAALVGKDADALARKTAETNGVTFPTHQARQFTKELGDANDLILVLEAGHKREIERMTPQFSGRTFLLSHWTDSSDIADPFRRSEEFHQIVFTKINHAAAEWAKRLARQHVG